MKKFTAQVDSESSETEDINENSDGHFMSCTKCLMKFDESDIDRLVFLETCSHIICKGWFEHVINREYIKKQMACCPECEQEIKENQIKEVLGEEAFSKIQKAAITAFIDRDNSMTQCPCGNILYIEPGKVDYNTKDENGKRISRMSAIHMSKHRVRCNDCSQNFCTQCKVQPYHLGKTCEQHIAFIESIKCRFCGDAIEVGEAAGAFKDVCHKYECQNMIKHSCDKVHPCGHAWKGFKAEQECLPCLHPECVEKNPDETRGEDDDSYCSICFVAGLGEQPSIKLGCGHIFHVDCIAEKIRQGYSGPRITFSFLNCPTCKQEIEAPHHPELHELLENARRMRTEITRKALERAKHEGLDKDKRLSNPEDQYYNDLEAYAMARLSFYTCYECKTPYFGGLKDWGNMLEAEANFNEKELVCWKCAAKNLDGQIHCDIHGSDYIEFKCRYCCNLAQWFWQGHTHYCDPCHRNAHGIKPKKCLGPEKWGLNVPHPDDGSEFALGCGLCRNSAFQEHVH